MGKNLDEHQQVANKMLLIARTQPEDETAKSIDGLSLFFTDPDRSKVEVREIEKMGRKCVDSNQVFIDGLEIPVEDRIGEEGKGFIPVTRHQSRTHSDCGWSCWIGTRRTAQGDGVR